MYKRKQFNVILAGLITLSVITIFGLIYAAFTQQLTIDGEATSRKSKWDIHFTNLSSISTYQSSKVLREPNIKDNDTTTIENYSVSLTSPGDYITFTFDVVNNGNYDAQISSMSISTPECSGLDLTSNNNVCNHIHYYLTYSNGASVQANDVILSKETQTMQVKLEYDNTVTAQELPTEDVKITNLGITINYEQANHAFVKDNGEVEESYAFYHIGDKITLNNEDYWVIQNSGAGQDYVVALKDERLTKEKINLYGGSGTDNNHVNKYTKNLVGYSNGGVAYYSSETCGYVNGSLIEDGCKTDYDQSDVKYVVDSWGEASFSNNELKDVNGYKSRLITKSEYESINNAYSWKTKQGYCWTMTPYDNNKRVYYANSIYGIANNEVHGGNLSGNFCFRPVINVYKSAIASE